MESSSRTDKSSMASQGRALIKLGWHVELDEPVSSAVAHITNMIHHLNSCLDPIKRNWIFTGFLRRWFSQHHVRLNASLALVLWLLCWNLIGKTIDKNLCRRRAIQGQKYEKQREGHLFICRKAKARQWHLEAPLGDWQGVSSHSKPVAFSLPVLSLPILDFMSPITLLASLL